ncbi:hypothetical protein NMG60_11003771 [Bertholletia excelsa]
MQSMKEKTANMGASAKSGMEKAKASAQEKVDRLRANDPAEREMAKEEKEERKSQAELGKQEAREHNAAARMAAGAGGYTTGAPETEYAATGQPTRRVTEGVVGGQNPVGEFTGNGRDPIQNTSVRSRRPAPGTGAAYDETEY